MKKQLLILSMVLLGGVTQCSFYERMKAKAASAAQSVKQSATSAYDKIGGVALSTKDKLSNAATSAYDKVGGMAQSASNKVQSAASNVRNTIGRETEAFMGGVRSIPSQVSAIKEDIEDKLALWGYRARKAVQQISPTMDKVTITNVETGETIIDYVPR